MSTRIVTFDHGAGATRYPKLDQLYLDEVQLYCDNGPCSPVHDLRIRALLRNMLVAHIAQLNQPAGGATMSAASSADRGRWSDVSSAPPKAASRSRPK